MSFEGELERIKAQIIAHLPSDIVVKKIEFEGPEIAVYSENSNLEVIESSDILKELARVTGYGYFIADASFAVAIVGKPRISGNWYIIDTSLVSMNMMLMACSLNIGTCCVGFLDREYTKKILEIDIQDYLLYILAVGHIKGDVPKPTLRKKFDEICRFID